MELTYNDAVQNMHTYLNEGRAYDKDLKIELSGELNPPDALLSVQMLDDLDNLMLKAQFVQTMLKGVGLTLRHSDEVLLVTQFTENERLSDITLLKQRPGLLRFIIDAIFSIFLKNSYPLSSESQKAE